MVILPSAHTSPHLALAARIRSRCLLGAASCSLSDFGRVCGNSKKWIVPNSRMAQANHIALAPDPPMRAQARPLPRTAPYDFSSVDPPTNFLTVATTLSKTEVSLVFASSVSREVCITEFLSGL